MILLLLLFLLLLFMIYSLMFFIMFILVIVLNMSALLNVLKGNGRAFCSGADVVRLYHSLNEGKLHFYNLLINKYIIVFIFNPSSEYIKFMQIKYFKWDTSYIFPIFIFYFVDKTCCIAFLSRTCHLLSSI